MLCDRRCTTSVHTHSSYESLYHTWGRIYYLCSRVSSSLRRWGHIGVHQCASRYTPYSNRHHRDHKTNAHLRTPYTPHVDTDAQILPGHHPLPYHCFEHVQVPCRPVPYLDTDS